jgi:hypothetical protein
MLRSAHRALHRRPPLNTDRPTRPTPRTRWDGTTGPTDLPRSSGWGGWGSRVGSKGSQGWSIRRGTVSVRTRYRRGWWRRHVQSLVTSPRPCSSRGRRRCRSGPRATCGWSGLAGSSLPSRPHIWFTCSVAAMGAGYVSSRVVVVGRLRVGPRLHVRPARNVGGGRGVLADGGAEEQAESVGGGGRARADRQLAHRPPQRGTTGQNADRGSGDHQGQPDEHDRGDQRRGPVSPSRNGRTGTAAPEAKNAKLDTAAPSPVPTTSCSSPWSGRGCTERTGSSLRRTASARRRASSAG